MKKKTIPVAVLTLALFLPHSALAWNATGHHLVARIAWEAMNENVRRNVIAILKGAPQDACMLDMFPNDSRPLAEREREFFVKVATWADVVRPNERQGSPPDLRPCTKFHRRDWHFINFFWKGISGATNADRPRDLTAEELKSIQRPDINAVILLGLLRPVVACDNQKCGTSAEERAMMLAWIVHLVGDIHQPLHTAARVTATEPNGDQGGNLCKLADSARFSLHSFWDGIIDFSSPKQQNESDAAYVERMAGVIMQEHPRSQMSARLQTLDAEAWAREGFETAKSKLYPSTLQCGPTRTPPPGYKDTAFGVSKEAIALAGYRLAELLSQMLGS